MRDLHERAASDPLTGLGHHASFHAALQEGCARPERRGTLALLVFDLDGFKRVNDTRGHQAGDHMLRRAVNERIAAGISVGVALHTRPEDPASFFARADWALYEAKRKGGNRVNAHPNEVSS